MLEDKSSTRTLPKQSIQNVISNNPMATLLGAGFFLRLSKSVMSGELLLRLSKNILTRTRLWLLSASFSQAAASDQRGWLHFTCELAQWNVTVCLKPDLNKQISRIQKCWSTFCYLETVFPEPDAFVFTAQMTSISVGELY